MKQETIVAQPVIEAPRMILRPLRASDAGLVALYAADRLRLGDDGRRSRIPIRRARPRAYVAQAMRNGW